MARVTYVAVVIGDLEHFVGEVLNLKCPRESVPAAKFLIASEPAAYCGFRRHPGVRTDGPKTFTVEEPKADRHSNLGIITGQTAALGRVVDVHRGYRGSGPAGLSLRWCRARASGPIRGRRRDRIVRVGCQRGAVCRVARARRLHISDYRLPAIIDVNVLDADILSGPHCCKALPRKMPRLPGRPSPGVSAHVAASHVDRVHLEVTWDADVGAVAG